MPQDGRPVFERLYGAYAAAVRRKLQRKLEGTIAPDEIEDLVQDVFLVAIRLYPRRPCEPDLERAWLLDVARKLAANACRRYRLQFEETLDCEPESTTDTTKTLEIRDLVRRVLARMQPLDGVLLRRELEGETLQQMAVWLGMGKSGAYVRLRHAKENFGAIVRGFDRRFSCDL